MTVHLKRDGYDAHRHQLQVGSLRRRRLQLFFEALHVVPVAGQPWSADPFALTEAANRLYNRRPAKKGRRLFVETRASVVVWR